MPKNAIICIFHLGGPGTNRLTLGCGCTVFGTCFTIKNKRYLTCGLFCPDSRCPISLLKSPKGLYWPNEVNHMVKRELGKPCQRRNLRVSSCEWLVWKQIRVEIAGNALDFFLTFFNLLYVLTTLRIVLNLKTMPVRR